MCTNVVKTFRTKFSRSKPRYTAKVNSPQILLNVSRVVVDENTANDGISVHRLLQEMSKRS